MTTPVGWDPLPSPGGGAGLLAVKSHSPATRVSASAGASLTALDTTNLRVSFTVPASGRVLLGLAAWAYAQQSGVLNWAALASGVLVPGSDQTVAYHTPSGEIQERVAYRALIVGLTAGATATWDWAHYRTFGSTTVGTHYGGAPSSGNPGPALMEVWSA